VIFWLLLLLLLTSNPVSAQTHQPRHHEKQTKVVVTTTATGYCLPGKMTNDVITIVGHKKAIRNGKKGCIALSRKLAKDLNLKGGKGTYNYKFGSIVVLHGTNGYDGEYIFTDLMPPQWRKYRVDIYFTSVEKCKKFGLKRCRLYVKL